MSRLKFINVLMMSGVLLSTIHAGDDLDKGKEKVEEILQELIHPEQSQVGSQENKVFMKEFRETFFDDWERMIGEKRDAEQTEKAKQLGQENETRIQESQRSAKSNPAVHKQQYRLFQDRKTFDVEQLSENYFRLLSTNPHKLIKQYEDNINALKKSFEGRVENINQFFRGKDFDLFDKNKDDFSRFYESYNEIKRLTSKLQSENINGMQLRIWSWRWADSDFSTIKSMLGTMKNDNPNNEDLKENIDLLLRLSEEMDEILKRYPNFENNKEIFNFVSKFLNSWDSENVRSFDEFERSTIEQIKAEQKKINFIKRNPEFFTIVSKLRSRQLGIAHPEHWDEKTTFKLGDDVTVGVIDTFPSPKGVQNHPSWEDRDKDISHGVHVAGIAVGNEKEKSQQKWNDLTIGVAPRAQLEKYAPGSLSLQDSSLLDMLLYTNQGGSSSGHRPGAQKIWDVGAMVGLIEDIVKILTPPEKSPPKENGSSNGLAQRLKFFEKEIEKNAPPPPKENPLKSNVLKNMVVGSKTKIFNMSMGTSSLARFSQVSDREPEGKPMLAVLTKLLQDRLIVFAMGNDGIDLSTSKQYRLFKALNTSDKTSPRVIMATNLMQDGLHLYKTSNTPGDDKNLQNRTLSALGTRVVSSLVQRKDADPRYGKMDGTSMAAPHVTGIAAVILSNFPELTAAELAMCLLDGATPILLDSKGNPYEFKEGMIPKRPAGNGKEFFYRTAKMLEEILGEAKKGEMEDVKPLLNGPTASKLREDWERGRRQYGMGRVNLEGSLYQAVLLLSSKNPEKVSDYKKILADYQSPADLDGQSSEQSSLPLSRKDIKKGLKAKFERYTSKEGGNKELLSEALELPAVPDSLLEEIKKYNDYQEKQKLP